MRRTASIETLVTQALQILSSFGVPTEGMTDRRRARMAKAFIAVSGLKPGQTWSAIIVDNPNHRPRSRDVIRWMNDYLGEQISSGSYDDIRRKDLLFPVEAGVILKAAGNDNAATNDGTRGYAINPVFAPQIRKFGTPEWDRSIEAFMRGKTRLSDELERKRESLKLPVTIGSTSVTFSPGEHNLIQRAVIEEFLPRFGYGAEVLYVGDTADKFLFVEREKLRALGFFDIAHDKLPDIVAYSQSKNWLYLIEAVHSANPINPMRKRTFESLTKSCAAGMVFVTAFLNRDSFKRFAGEIAWETEAWIADNPDHLIHFNGDRFLGPHPST